MSLAGDVQLGARAVAQPLQCLHCGQGLTGVSVGDFCCRGCQAVYALIGRSGLGRYYDLRGEQVLAPAQRVEGPRDLQWLDQLLASVAPGPLRRFTLDIQGIQCAACVWLVETVFKRSDDAHQIQLNPALGRVAMAVGPAFDLRGFVGTVEQLGYRLGQAHKTAPRTERPLALRMGICLCLAGNTMLLSAATYFGLRSGPLFVLVQHAIFALTTLSVLIGGSYFFERAWESLKRGILHLDLPIAVGMAFAYAGSVWSTYVGHGRAAYFDTVAVFIALMLVGRVVQERLVERNRKQLLAADGASSLTARRIREGRAELVQLAMLAVGDTLLVCPGEIVPVSARLRSEHGRCSLEWISGESAPRSVQRGDTLCSGATNVGDTAMELEAVGAFDRSELDTLLQTDAAPKGRLASDFWDRLSRIYVALVLAAAGLGVAIFLALGRSVVDTLDMATAVLVITCPCAFGIATPLAYELAVSGLRKAGLFVREGSFFDRAAGVTRIVFDKTGTLTTGGLALRDPQALAVLAPAEREVLYNLAVRSNHPKSVAIALAVRDLYAQVRMGDYPVREEAGLGVECEALGARYRLGAPTWSAEDAPKERGPVFSRDHRMLCVLDTVEQARPDAAREIDELARSGYELWIASGDTQARVDAMAKGLQIAPNRALGDLGPHEKRALLERLDRRDTLMVGDGINDGPALSQATCSGTPAIDRPFVPSRADFYFLTAGLTPLRTALRVSLAVRRVVRHALGFATAYNVLAVGLAYAGLMRPWLAAVLMPASSLLVVTYTTLRLSPRRSLWKS